MTVQLNPYLNFAGLAEAAIDFYATVFGGTPEKMRFSDTPGMPGVEESEANQLMHSSLTGDNGINLMAADLPKSHGTPGANSSVSLSGDDDATLRGYWEKLSDGAEIQEPLATAPWGDSFGMLKDKFGVPWLVNIAGNQQG